VSAGAGETDVVAIGLLRAPESIFIVINFVAGNPPAVLTVNQSGTP
jgi:hypothetical protein